MIMEVYNGVEPDIANTHGSAQILGGPGARPFTAAICTNFEAIWDNRKAKNLYVT